jgi:hypothetical protein
MAQRRSWDIVRCAGSSLACINASIKVSDSGLYITLTINYSEMYRGREYTLKNTVGVLVGGPQLYRS